LIELLWQDAPPADAAKALQVHVSRLRRALAQEDVIRTRPGGYLLEVDAGNFDLPRFEQRAEEARSLLARGNAEAARRAFGDALAAYRDARRALAEELGIEPGRPLQELEQSILRQDAALDVRPRDAGLRPGRRAAGLLVGRERELDELLSALEDAAAGRGRLF